MTSVNKNGLLSRRSVCGSGVSAAALMLAGCGGGGGGGDASSAANSGNSTGSVNSGLTGAIYYSNIDQTLKIDLATGNETQIRFRNQDTPSGSSYVTDARFFDLSADNKTLFFMDDLGTERLAAVDIESKAARTVFIVGRAPDWAEIRLSPDGQKFAMVKDGINGVNGVYIVDTAGKAPPPYAVTKGAYNSVSWTRDNRLLFTDDGIYLTDPGDLQNATQISPILSDSISLNPAGDKIAYASQGHIWTMGITGDNVQQITASKNATEFRPRWSPDGKYIVFKSGFTSIVGGSTATNGTLYLLAVVPADGKLYTLKTADSVNSGGIPSSGTTGRLVAGDGVIALEYLDDRQRKFNIIADDMMWR
jgi:hypothetical protein